MIIKQLRFYNFLVFPGEQVMDLPTQKDSNIVVVLAPNNTGKTSVIRALKFLFYGHLSDCTAGTAYHLINDRARAETKVGSEAYGWVEITLEREDEPLSIRRIIKSRRSGKDQWLEPHMSLCRVIQDVNNGLIGGEEDLLETKLRTLVPENLFDAFYFKGEPLDGRLLGGVGDIRRSLAAFLHEDLWKEAEEAAEAVRQSYTRELEKLTEKHTEYNKLLRNEELFRSHMLREQEQLREKRDSLVAATSDFEDITSRLQELGTGGDAEKLIVQLREYRAKLNRAQQTRERADLDIARLVGTSRGIPFVLGAVPMAQRILAQMQQDNILPADVSERFVDRVLSGAKCVCGRQHDDDTRASWTRYREKTLTADLNRGMSDLLAAIQPKCNEGGSNECYYERLSIDLAAKLRLLQDSRVLAIKEIQQLDAAVRNAEGQLERSPIEQIQQLSRQLRDLSNKRQQLQGEASRLEQSIEFTQKNLKRLQDEKEKARPPAAIQHKERVLEKCTRRAEDLRQLIHESREVLSKSFHRILQNSVTEYYDHSAYDGSHARINRTTLLPAIESNGQIHGNLGGGQSQLLALAYIVSLSRLRKSLHTEMQKLGIGFGKLDDQSFFLDSPFNHMTDHYAHAIAKFLGGNARQVVLLLARHQWNLVKEIIEPATDRLLTFKYHTLPDKIAELKKKDPTLEDFTYKFRGSRYQVRIRGHVVSRGTGFRDAMRSACGQAAEDTRVGKREGGLGNCVTRRHPHSNR